MGLPELPSLGESSIPRRRGRYRSARREHYREHWWILSKTGRGKPVLIYGGTDEQEASNKAFNELGNRPYKIVMLPTSDTSMASRMLRGRKLEQSHDLDDAMERQTHEKGLARERQRGGF